jgi:hypothetical protein
VKRVKNTSLESKERIKEAQERKGLYSLKEM